MIEINDTSEAGIDHLQRAMLADYSGWYPLPSGAALFMSGGAPVWLTDNAAGPDGPSEGDMLGEARDVTGLRIELDGAWQTEPASGAQYVAVRAPRRVYS